jgi:RNA polymerase sigma factor (TIGR02999 family)
MEPRDVTGLLTAAADDPAAAARLYEIVYAELRSLAATALRREFHAHTLQPTALVSEAYLRLAPSDGWENRAHFFGAAAQAMRRVLVDYARHRNAAKRGDGAVRVTLTGLDLPAATQDVDVEALDDALRELRGEEPRAEQVVTLRYFAGLSVDETAEALAISPATVKRDWEFARSWLYARLQG